MSRIGLELGPDNIRAVCLSGWPRTEAREVEVSWDPENPAEAVDALREHLPAGGRLAIAVSLSFLRIRQLSLPPLPREEKLRILRLEPERYFAVRDQELVYSLVDDRDLVFATEHDWLEETLRQLESIGRIEHVEAAPPALARVLARGGVDEAVVIQSDGATAGLGLMELRAGRVESARRIFGSTEQGDGWANGLPAAVSGTSAPLYLLPWSEAEASRLGTGLERKISPLPAIAGLEANFLTAYGAALAVGQEHASGLVPAGVERRIARRRRRERALAITAAVAALILAVSGLDARRARAAERLDGRLGEVRSQAAEVIALQAEAESLMRETQELEAIERLRPRALEVLSAVSDLLPGDAYVRVIRLGSTGWQIDGYATDAAALVPLFEDHPEFEDVRFLSATTRSQLGGRTYETFSLALRHVPAS